MWLNIKLMDQMLDYNLYLNRYDYAIDYIDLYAIDYDPESIK